MALLSNVAASLLVPEYGLLLAPYAFDTLAQTDCVVDEHMGGIFGESFEAAGAVYLGSVEVGRMVIMSKTPVHAPADLESLKIRTSPTQTDTFYIDAAGAAAVPLGTVDSMPALKTGSVVAVTTPIVMGVAGGYAQEAPEITRTHHGHQIGAMLISSRSWDGLSDAHKTALSEAADLLAGLRPAIRDAEEALLRKAAAAGATIHTPTETEMDAWKSVGAAAIDKILDETGGAAPEVWTAIDAAKKSCDGRS